MTKVSALDHTASGSSTYDFTVFTSAMEVDTQAQNVVRMIGSSTEQDLQGDTMLVTALADMCKVDPNLTIWLNHEYDLPDKLFGSLCEAPLLQQQSGIADLHLAVDVEMSNPAATKTLGYIKNGRRLGCSVGCMVEEYELSEDDDYDGWFPPLIIHHVRTVEFSVVGIPANQRAWVEMAARGIFERALAEGRGEEAVRLAPAVKGLYPRAYQETVRGLPEGNLRKELERVQPRPTPRERVEWVPLSKTFVLNRKGNYTALQPGEIGEVVNKNLSAMRTLRKSALPAMPAALPEQTTMDAEVEQKKGVSGKTTWPLADRDRAWESSAALQRIQAWAGGDDGPDWQKVKSVHFWYDDDKADIWSGYKLLFCDVIDGAINAIPRAIFAVAAALQGARGGADIPEADQETIKSRVETYYNRMADEFNDNDIKIPWASDEKSTQPESVKASEEPMTETNAPVEKQEQEALPAALAQSGAQELDVHLYNALGLRLGLSPIAIDADGRVLHPPRQPSAFSAESVQEVLAKALQIVKDGQEFSQENRMALKALHDGLRDMCKSSFNVCKDIADGDATPGAADGDAGYNDVQSAAEDAAEQMATLRGVAVEVTKALEVVRSLDLTALEAWSVLMKGSFNDVLSLQKSVAQVKAECRTAAEAVALLKNMPLGRPTSLIRSVQPGDEGVATYEDFAGKEKSVERTWTLEDALAQTQIVQESIGGSMMYYRFWPEGVGGTVGGRGVRPALTNDQKSFMRPSDIGAYPDGGAARVALIDDPAGLRS